MPRLHFLHLPLPSFPLPRSLTLVCLSHSVKVIVDDHLVCHALKSSYEELLLPVVACMQVDKIKPGDRVQVAGVYRALGGRVSGTAEKVCERERERVCVCVCVCVCV
jgi:hypothetical protein